MLHLIRSLLPPLLSLMLMMIGSGFFNTFVPLRLEMAGNSFEMIGLVTSSVYLGILLGSLWIDRWISRVGHAHAFISFAAVLGAIALFQGIWVNVWYWAVLRFIGGICSAGVFIVIESWLLLESSRNLRGQILSIYLAVLYASLSLGQFLLNIASPLDLLPYSIAALFAVFSVLPISLQKIAEPKLHPEAVRINLIGMYKISPLGFVGGIISGMILAVVYGFVPIFAKEIGMSFSEVALFMAIIILGGFSLQWPVGRWADRGDRHKIIQIVSFITAILAIGIGMSHTFWLLYLIGFFFGGFSFTIYPLSMAYACERVKENEIVTATGGFVFSYGIGAILGPVLAPLAMSYLDVTGIFYFLGFISVVLGIVGLKKPAPVYRE